MQLPLNSAIYTGVHDTGGTHELMDIAPVEDIGLIQLLSANDLYCHHLLWLVLPCLTFGKQWNLVHFTTVMYNCNI